MNGSRSRRRKSASYRHIDYVSAPSVYGHVDDDLFITFHDGAGTRHTSTLAIQADRVPLLVSIGFIDRHVGGPFGC